MVADLSEPARLPCWGRLSLLRTALCHCVGPFCAPLPQPLRLGDLGHAARWTSQLSGATQELAKQASGKSEGAVEVDDSSDDLEATEAMVVDAAQQEADRLRAREQLQAQEKKLSESLAEAGTQEQLDACKHRERSPRRKTKAREEPLSEKPATTEPDNAHPGKAS